MADFSELEDRLAALDAEDGSRVPHEVAVAIMRGQSPVRAFRGHLGITLRDLSASAGISVSYLSEIVFSKAWSCDRLTGATMPPRRTR